MKTNLVIGSDGFLGKPFCEYLKNKGEKVIPFDIKRGDNEDARVAQLDLDEIDCVYFLAWDVGGAKYLYNKDFQLQQLDWNMKILLNVMPQLQVSKKPFLFISSQLAEEYDTVYGTTKRLGEVWTKLIGGVFIRQWNAYGPVEEESIRSHVISDFVHQALSTGTINMLTTGEEKRQFIHIDDICDAWYTALNQKLEGIHDVTSFEWIKVIDVARMIADMTGATVIPGEKVGSTPLTPIKGKIPGWNPKIDLKTGLERIINEAKKNASNR